MDDNLKARIKKGYDYFYNLKPSKVSGQDVIFLHAWLKLLNKVVLDNPDIDRKLDERELYEVAKIIFE